MKIKEYLSLILKCKIVFSVEKKDIAIFDCTSSYELYQIFSKNSVIIPSRKDKIKNLYMTKKIIFSLLKNIFKRKLKLNYFIGLLEEIDAKVVITHIDNSVEFSKLAKILKDKMTFVAVQNANRGDIFENRQDNNQALYLPNFICFSKFDKELYKKKNIKVNKFHIAGSLRNSYFDNFFKKSISNLRHDICFVSKSLNALQNPLMGSINYTLKLLAKYVKENKKTILIAAKTKYNFRQEKMYKDIFFEANYKIIWADKKYNSYRAIYNSNIVIGLPSTLLREAFIYKKKILCCEQNQNSTKHHPFIGLNYINNFSYSDFEERLNQLFSINKENYHNELEKFEDYYMSSINTVEYLKNYLKKEIENFR